MRTSELEVGKVHWHVTKVADRAASYGEAGPALPVTNAVVFLHGWALSDHTYRRSIDQLSRQGFRVLAPALPGFGGTAGLPPDQMSLEGYAAWLIQFMDTVGLTEPVTLVGHSFGGAVAIKCAHDFPTRVSRLVLVNSIGGATWSDEGRLRSMQERSPMDWGVHLGAGLLSVHGLTRVLPVIAADALAHALTRPWTVWRVGRMAMGVDLADELNTLKRRGTPVAVLWGREDTVVPKACHESLIAALGRPHVVTVAGDHGWLIADPERFVEVLTNVLGLLGDDGRAA